ncbi:MAG: geranyl transferase [Cycloclasticus sp.]|nr:MAG: geranyl transferase [Cycloclasticus sp.]
MTSFETFQQIKSAQIEAALASILPSERIEPKGLHSAMRYSTLNGGKRIRALLVYATGHLFDVKQDILDSIACAIELIHSYSLIHDDLPAMDDDDLRRGKPSCHIIYGEATAILAGDALLTLAFKVITNSNASAEQKVNVIQLLSQAAGSRGMVGGQAIDLNSERKQISITELESMHLHKTGALICACITMVVCMKHDSSHSDYLHLKHYAGCIGLAFQVQDDILDETSSTAALGKTQGKDKHANKATYPALLGLKPSKQLTKDLYEDAISHLSHFGERADYLRQIAEFTVSRHA